MVDAVTPTASGPPLQAYNLRNEPVVVEEIDGAAVN
jgi:hypothetical protein